MTDKSAREVIAGAVLSVCSDGNSDNTRVASDILAALEAGGFAVVPKVPTEAMHNAARDWSAKKYGTPIGIDASDGCYKAMLAAANPKEEGSDN